MIAVFDDLSYSFPPPVPGEKLDASKYQIGETREVPTYFCKATTSTEEVAECEVTEEGIVLETLRFGLTDSTDGDILR